MKCKKSDAPLPSKSELSLTIKHSKSTASSPLVLQDASILVQVSEGTLILDLPEGFCVLDDELKLVLLVNTNGTPQEIEVLASVAQLDPDHLNTKKISAHLQFVSSVPTALGNFISAIEEYQKHVRDIIDRLKE